MIERPRLLPAVILGAMGLLALKLLAWTADPAPGKVPANAPVFTGAAHAGQPEAELPQLARGIVRAHGSLKFVDPDTTGSVDKPVNPKAERERAEAEKAEAARLGNPNNKAGLINGTQHSVSPAERALLERLSERREEIESRMRELEMRERLLDTAEKKLDGRVGDLKALEEKLGGPGAKPAVEEAKAIKNLVIMYEAMKPKDAARVFDRLGLDVLVPVVQQMNPRKMSEVLAAMTPERAEKLTVALATTARGASLGSGTAQDAAALPGNELPAVAPATRR